MATVKMDQKMRIRLPKDISRKLGLKQKAVLNIEIEGDEIRLSKPKSSEIEDDPVIKDMTERLMHPKIRVTSRLLERWKEEMWNP